MYDETENNDDGVLTTWMVEAEIPAMPRGKARRRRQNGYSGHAMGEDGGELSLIGPRESESGHVIGPRQIEAWTAARMRVCAALDRAERFKAWIDAKPGRTAADLARKEGVSRARVSQVLRLVHLAPEVVARVRDFGRAEAVPSVKALHAVA